MYNYYQKYMSWHGKQFTDINKNIKWCPDPKCESIIEMKDAYTSDTVVTCRCGNTFCFKCENEDHQPSSCA